MEEFCLEMMSDDRVLERVDGLIARSNEITAELLAHLMEVERRGLHLREACSSLFAFCVERLRMSESAAGKRITAMRTARRFPLVLEMIARGDIHLTTVNMLAAHLTEENCAELLARARHRSKREIEALVAEITPRPDVASRVTVLPQQTAPVATTGPAGVGLEVRAPERAPRPAVVAPLSPRRYEIRVTVDEETHGKLRQLMDLLAHSGVRDPAEVISRGIDLLHQRTLAKKAAIVDRPRDGKPAQKRTRNIPAAVERAVWTRDGGRCAFVDGKGRRCSSTAWLEFHHVNNWARGAEHAVGEIQLRCRAHNQYQAELDDGAELIAARRADGSSRARERSPAWAHEPVQHRELVVGERERLAEVGRREVGPRLGEVERAKREPSVMASSPPRAHRSQSESGSRSESVLRSVSEARRARWLRRGCARGRERRGSRAGRAAGQGADTG